MSIFVHFSESSDLQGGTLTDLIFLCLQISKQTNPLNWPCSEVVENCIICQNWVTQTQNPPIFAKNKRFPAILNVPKNFCTSKFWKFLQWIRKVFTWAFRQCIVWLGYFQQLKHKITLNTRKNGQKVLIQQFFLNFKAVSFPNCWK